MEDDIREILEQFSYGNYSIEQAINEMQTVIKQKEKNCLPEGLKTIEDKIQYVKDVYSISGDKGNLLDWLIGEINKVP